jgi:hypothetical protein
MSSILLQQRSWQVQVRDATDAVTADVLGVVTYDSTATAVIDADVLGPIPGGNFHKIWEAARAP